MEPLIIKLSKGGRSLSTFHKIENMPFTIGRAYDNDLIVADSTVSPHHLRILCSETGYQVQDLNSDNGSWIDDKQIEDTGEPLTYPTTINIGRTHLEVFAASTSVKTTRAYTRMSPFSGVCSTLRAALMLLGAFFGLTLYLAYERLSISQGWDQILISQLSFLILPIVFAAFMGFLSRMFLHSWRYALQLSIACLGFMTLALLSESSDFINYFFTSQSISNNFDLLLSVVVLTAFFKWQLTAISSMTSRKSFLISLAVVCTLVGVLRLQSSVNRTEFSPQPSMHTRLQRHDWRLLNTEQSLSGFLANLQVDLQSGLQAELSDKSE